MKNLTDFLKQWEPVWIRAWSTMTIATHPPKLRVLKSGLILYVSTFCHLFFPGLRPVPITMSRTTIWIGPGTGNQNPIVIPSIPWCFLSPAHATSLSIMSWVQSDSKFNKNSSVMSSYRTMLLELSNSLTTENLQELKFLCADVIPAGRLERITQGIELFGAMEELNMLSEENRDFLASKLIAVNRNDLRNKLLGIQGKL